MKEYSIEYAHIYTNQDINLEHEFSTEILKNIFTEIEAKDASLVVMVDDYSFPDPSFSYSNFSKYMDQKGYHPDIILRESQLIPACDIVLGLLNDVDLKKGISKYIISNKKYPCSLFIAAWYLLRLGKIESAIFDIGFSGKKLINILPESFEPFENKALDIIQATKYSDVISYIENRYFDGRIIF